MFSNFPYNSEFYIFRLPNIMFRTWIASQNFSVRNLTRPFTSLSTTSRLKKILIDCKSSHQVSFN